VQTPQQILLKYWGFSSFRPLQEDIVNSIIEGNDTLALLPTGGGKSICFQVPALVKEGICIVVSPLIALMKDQVQNLKSRGIKATAIYSGMTIKEIDITLDNCIYGGTKFLYVSPERLKTELFQVRVQKMNVNMIAVDEAHCISQWGYDFRPSYMEIAEMREILPEAPIMALTATATPDVVIDIQERLKFKTPNVFQKSFARSNLSYNILFEEDKYGRLLKIANKIQGTAVVYVRNRKRTKEIADFLVKNNISADYYHAGLDPKLRDFKQLQWINNKTRIIVSTNAFGMGIDKPDVRFVVHMDLPDSIEAYFQEAGRGGRDEKTAYAVQLYSKYDITSFEENITNSFPEISQIKQVYSALGNFFQLAVGSGLDETFNFTISDFCNRNNLPALLVYHCFKFLEKEGYIIFSDAMFQPAKVQFIVGSGELYKFQIANKRFDSIIKTLLRSNSGLFDNYGNINEDTLAKRLKTTKDIFSQYLGKLHEYQIIDYIPQSNTPKITYTVERLHEKNLRISKEHYDFRKKVAFDKMKSVLEYITSTTKCRSQQLLSYFGEKNSTRCGVCDICRERNKLDMNKIEFSSISDQLKAILSKNECSTTEIVNQIKAHENEILKVMEWLIDNGKILQIGGKLSWNTNQ
jgi:ATP-dependent DNA helicase RecQ